MATILRPKVNLIKCSIRVGHIPSALEGIVNLRNNNSHKWFIESDRKASYIYRCPDSSLVFQIFYSGHINITGIPKELEIASAVSSVCDLIKVSKCLQETVVYTIDNIQATGKLNLASQSKSLKELSDALNRMKLEEEWWISRINFDTNVFPAIIIKFTAAFDNPQLCGTALIFNNRKFVLVGLRHVSSVNLCHNYIETIMHQAASPQHW